MKVFFSGRTNALRRLWILSTALGCLGYGAVHAAQSEQRREGVIEVSAEAEVEVAADVALIDLGVTTRAATAAAAARDNGERMQAVLARVRSAAGAKAQLSTGTYALNPVYTNPRDGTEQRVVAYSATNVTHVRTAELTRVGELIDIAVQAGANQVQRIGFTLGDESAPRDMALRNAVLKARHEAEVIAGALGLKITSVHSAVVQDTGVPRPLFREALMARADAAGATPVEAGSVPVRARVVLSVEIAR
jgi:uncharacterized protein YggE